MIFASFQRRPVWQLAAALTALVVVPYLGAVGLWDPWETQYAEVGREMLERGDFIHPHWHDGWFFSKPVLTPWLAAFGLWVVGAHHGDGALPIGTEWAVRLPFALLSIAAVTLLAHAVGRLASRRAGLFTALALSTMPLWLFVSRQAITDMAYVAPATIALAAFSLALFEDGLGDRARRWWAVLGFAACGVAVLAKGAVGAGLPLATVTLAIAVGSERIAAVRRLSLHVGLPVLLIIAMPWYAAMLAFEGRDPEGKTFFERFVLHDHFARLGTGVHSPTAGGSFTYFVEQLGYGLFPWVLLIPLALFHLMRAPSRLAVLHGVAVAFGFLLFTLSATRYHHYALPLLPSLAVLIALALDDAMERPAREWLMPATFGVVLLAIVGKDLAARPRHFIDLFTYNHQRPYPDALVSSVGPMLGWATALVAIAFVGALIAKRPKLAVGVGGAAATALALWLGWSHWVALSHHWTQRELFSRYFEQRAPSEPIAAFWMDWKGETLYSRDRVLPLGPANWQQQTPMFLARTGRKWMLVEHARSAWLQQVIGPGHQVVPIDPWLTDKFVLLRID